MFDAALTFATISACPHNARLASRTLSAGSLFDPGSVTTTRYH